MPGSSPNWPYGYIPTAAEWDGWWASKLDVTATGVANVLDFGADPTRTTDSTAAVQVVGGTLEIMGGGPYWKETPGCELMTVNAGILMLRSLLIGSHTNAHTAPFIHQSGTGVLNIDGCNFFNSGLTGTAVQMDTIALGAMVGANNNFFGLRVTGSGVPDTTFPTEIASPHISNSLYIGSSTLGANTVLNGPASSQRQIIYQSAGVIRWVLRLLNDETGGNSGSDWGLQKADDAGTLTNTPVMQIARSTGMMTVPGGITLTGPNIRSGAGAATGTQPKGSLWLRTDGAAGSTLYVSQGGGTWNAVAGV